MKSWWSIGCLGLIGNILLYGFLFIVLLVSSCNKKNDTPKYHPTTTRTTTTATRTTTNTNNYNTTKTVNTNSYNKSNDYSNEYRRLQYGSYDDYKDRVPEEYREEYPYKEYIEDRAYQNSLTHEYTRKELANQLWVDEAEIREYEY